MRLICGSASMPVAYRSIQWRAVSQSGSTPGALMVGGWGEAAGCEYSSSPIFVYHQHAYRRFYGWAESEEFRDG